MIAIPQLIVAWLTANSEVNTTTGGRISTLFEPDQGVPALVVGVPSGGPVATGQHSLSAREEWTIPLYCIAGRRGGGAGDAADYPTAWALAQQVGAAMNALDTTWFTTDAGSLIQAEVRTMSQGVLPGNFARVLINARVLAVASQQG